MQFLIDQAEDRAREIRHMPPEEVDDAPRIPGSLSRPASGASSRPQTSKTDASGSRPGTSKTDASASRPGTSKSDASGDGEDDEPENDEGPENEEPTAPLSRTFSLDLSNYKATSISGRIYDLGTALTSLDISNNRLSRISPDMGELSGLVSLNISHNRILKLPAELEDLVNLKNLDMR